MTDNVTPLLEQLLADAAPAAQTGVVADYIPALARVDTEKFGVAICFCDGRQYHAGHAFEPFSIQSICKAFHLSLALDWLGGDIWQRVGRDPSGMTFNSLIQLEQEAGIPRNPFINSGAIVVVDALLERYPQFGLQFTNVMRELSSNDDVFYNNEVRDSEEEHGDLNRAIAWLLRAKNNLNCHPDDVLSAYFLSCSMAMSCVDLARAGRFLANEKYQCRIGNSEKLRRRVLSTMLVCGMYDAAGDFAYRVGLPAKSGVGGGILAIKPGDYSVCVWSPPLDAKGNSAAGVKLLEKLSDIEFDEVENN